MLQILIEAYKPSPKLPLSSLIRDLTFGHVLHLQTTYHKCSQQRRARHFLICHYITGDWLVFLLNH